MTKELKLPESTEAESALLGGMLRDPRLFPVIAGIVQERHFYSHANRVIWRKIGELVKAKSAVDLVTLMDELTKTGDLDKCGGPCYLAGLEDVGTPVHSEYYAQIVRDKATMRELIAVCGQIQEEVLSSSGNTSEILNLAQEKLAKVIRDGLIRHNSVSLREATDKLMESLEAIASGNTATGGAPIPTGYPALDRMFSGGFKRGEFHIVAGRPSMGKTSFGMNLIRSVALDQHIPSMVFTMEADRDTFVAELICQRMRIESKCIRGMISKSVLAQLKDGCGYVQDSPLMISDDTCLSLAEIRSRIWDSVQRDGTAFVMIDYLQLIRAPEMSRRNERREQEVAEISRTLKGIAREAKVAMICLAQLNREAEGRATHIPMLSDLRESGSLEADADGVMLLYRPGYYSRDASDKSAKVIVAKQRHGPTGDVDMIFIPEYMRFEEASARQEERPENWQDR